VTIRRPPACALYPYTTLFRSTLAGYVHWRLTGRRVLGVGDASGMFPIDSTTGTYDTRMLEQFDELVGPRLPAPRVVDLLPDVLRSEERRVGKECRSRQSPSV